VTPARQLQFALSLELDSVSCAENEVLAGLVCASGGTNGSKCATPGTAATGLCVRG
jgi:hypothetical protein